VLHIKENHGLFQDNKSQTKYVIKVEHNPEA